MMNFNHVALPIVFSRKCPPAILRVVAAIDRTMKFLPLFMSIVDMALQVCLGAKALTAARVRALVVFAMITLVMPTSG